MRTRFMIRTTLMVFLFSIFASSFALAATAPTIKNINNREITLIHNSEYKLPSVIDAAMSNQKVVKQTIIWSPAKLATDAVGVFTFKGSVKGYKLPIILKVNVVAFIQNVNTIMKTLYVGDGYSLPETVTVQMSDGYSQEVAIVWENTNVDLKTVGIQEFIGHVAGYKPPVTLKLKIRSNFMPLSGTTKLMKFGYYVVVFSKTINPALDPNQIYFIDKNQTKIYASQLVIAMDDEKILLVYPSSSLDLSTTYQLIIPKGSLKAKDGELIGEDFNLPIMN